MVKVSEKATGEMVVSLSGWHADIVYQLASEGTDTPEQVVLAVLDKAIARHSAGA